MQIFRHIFYEIEKKSDLFCKKEDYWGLKKTKKLSFWGENLGVYKLFSL